MLRNRALLLPALVLVFASSGASARTTMHDLDVQEATASELGKQKLLDVPVYMAGQTHRRVTSDLGVFTANRRTNAFGKSDEQACRIAFLSALISLQNRALKLGADAVVDIKSTTRNQELASATQYRCAAGNVVANVVLTGRVVKLKK